jgi:hypothetical protein
VVQNWKERHIFPLLKQTQHYFVSPKIGCELLAWGFSWTVSNGDPNVSEDVGRRRTERMLRLVISGLCKTPLWRLNKITE